MLHPFAEHHAIDISHWPLNAEEAVAWAGVDTEFPIASDLFQRWHQDADVHAFVADDNGFEVAYGELWVDHQEHEVELARIIVHPSHRGIGVGRAFVTSLLQEAAKYGMPNIFLRVIPNNFAAIRCYENCGFLRVDPTEEKFFNERQPRQYAWFRYAHSNSSAPWLGR